MAVQLQSPFTNTRLMLAGVVCGAIGAVLAVLYINKVKDELVGEEVYVYYMNQKLPMNEPLALKHYDRIKVRKTFVDKVDKMVWGTKVETFIGASPSRRLNPGEPLVTTWFDSEVDRGPVSTPPAGSVEVGVRVDPQRGIGQSMDVGSIVSLRGTFRLGPRGDEEAYVVTMKFLQAVQVETINGLRKPNTKDRKKVTHITIYVGNETATWLTQLENEHRMEGFFRIGGEPAGTRRSEPNKEIPRETLDKLKDKLQG